MTDEERGWLEEEYEAFDTASSMAGYLAEDLREYSRGWYQTLKELQEELHIEADGISNRME